MIRIIPIFLLLLISCTRKYEVDFSPIQKEQIKSPVSESYKTSHFNRISFVPGNKANVFSIKIADSKNREHYISIDSVKMDIFFPTLPENFKGDIYLENSFFKTQKENPYLIDFQKKSVSINFKGSDFEASNVSTLRFEKTSDLRKQWKLIILVHDSEKELPYFEANFDMPKAVFESVFEWNNKLEASNFKVLNENNIGFESKKLDLKKLLVSDSSSKHIVENLNNYNYPDDLSKARGLVKNPTNFAFIKELLNDNTKIFNLKTNSVQQVYYDRLANLSNFFVYEKNDLNDLELVFLNSDSTKITRLIIGNFKKQNLSSQAEIWPMGIGIRPFDEPYDIEKHAFKYAVLVDENDNALSPEMIGIGGFKIFNPTKNNYKHQLFIFGPNKEVIIGNYNLYL